MKISTIKWYILLNLGNWHIQNQAKTLNKKNKTDNGHNVPRMLESLHHFFISTWLLPKRHPTRSNMISFKPYLMGSRPDFSAIFWPDYLGINSKIKSRAFPRENSWMGLCLLVWYHGTGDYQALGAQNRVTNLISFWILQQSSRNKMCNPISHTNLNRLITLF